MSYEEIANKTAVIITVYNREDLVKNAVGSIVNQTLRPGGIIVVDDASKDKSGQAAVDCGDGLVTIITLPVNMGAGVAKRAGFSKAKELGFEFVMCLDSDDIYEKEAIEVMSTAMARYDADLVACSVRNVWRDKDGNILKERNNPRKGVIAMDHDTIRRLIPLDMIDVFANAKLVKIDLVLNPPYSDKRYQEDTESTCWWLINSGKVVVLPYTMYVYNHGIIGQLTENKDSLDNAVASILAVRKMMETLGVRKAKDISDGWILTISRYMGIIRKSDMTKNPYKMLYREVIDWADNIGIKISQISDIHEK